MTETDTAEGIAAGRLTSPQRIGSSWLWALRVSGTGIAQRPALREFVIRDPEVFLSDAMIRRCTGLPIVLGHPPGGVLNGPEFAARSVGVTVLAYVHDGALWCIGRIFDDDVNTALQAGALSTSPSAVFQPTDIESAIELGGGHHLVIEGEPATIDHLALVEAGVWDRGHQRGVRADELEKGKTVPDEKDTQTPDPAADALEKILSAVTDALGRIDAMSGRLDEVCSRVDGMQADRQQAAAEVTAADATGTEIETFRDGENQRRGAAMAELGRKSVEAEREFNQKLAEAQSRADSVAVAFGQRAPAPMMGETVAAYRRRLLRPFKEYSADWKGINVDGIADPAMLAVIEQRVFADAVKAAERCDHLADDGPHPVTRNVDGRTITEYRGRRSFIHGMKAPTQRVTKFHLPQNQG